MSVQKGHISNVPKNAVVLSESDALDYQLKMVNQWSPSYEMWPLKFGSMYLAATCAATGFIISEQFRGLCLLPKYSRWMVGVPITTFSALGVLLFQSKIITEDVMLNKTSCIPCLQGRSAMLQGFFGSVYPTIILSFGSTLFAQRLNIKLIPQIDKGPSKMLKFCQQMMLQKRNLLTIICGIQVALAFIVTDLQVESVFKLNQRR